MCQLNVWESLSCQDRNRSWDILTGEQSCPTALGHDCATTFMVLGLWLSAPHLKTKDHGCSAPMARS